ncbi:LacI family transcriptional regulator [bacterium]|nr:LacI family transcriptional regulator [bacterium]MDY4581451.1 LacI family DNA-binding transcriptional regulator [Candidatus Faecousia sp.]
MVTIADVARAAGVSVATVSRVMNGSGSVAEPTVQVVQAAIERLNYIPNQQARNLRKNENRSILVLLPNITNIYYACVFDGINRRAQELGYNLFLCNTEGRDPQALIQETISSRRVDGAILLHISYNEDWLPRYARQLPIVQCCEYTGHGNVPHVTVDNYRAAFEATQYLIQLGHKRIGTISAANNNISTLQRMKGFRDAMAQAELPVPEGCVAYSDVDYSYPSSLKAARKILTQREPPSAVFCISDSVALATVVVAQEVGLQVPRDVSVIGFDDVMYTQMFHPYLTTVVQPCAELGSRAVDMLCGLITEGRLLEREVTLPHGFHIRESTCSAK